MPGPNHETELEAAERRIASIRPCAAAKLAGMEQSFRNLLESVGEDPERQGLLRTPCRAARAFDFLTNGYRQSLEALVNGAIFDSDASEIVLVKDIELYSMASIICCRSSARLTLLTFLKVKSSGFRRWRASSICSRAGSDQENLTIQIADALLKTLQPTGVAVVIEAKHLCMMMRGVEKQNSVMKTSCLLGSFKEDARTRSEFLSCWRDGCGASL